MKFLRCGCAHQPVMTRGWPGNKMPAAAKSWVHSSIACLFKLIKSKNFFSVVVCWHVTSPVAEYCCSLFHQRVDYQFVQKLHWIIIFCVITRRVLIDSYKCALLLPRSIKRQIAMGEFLPAIYGIPWRNQWWRCVKIVWHCLRSIYFNMESSSLKVVVRHYHRQTV